MGAVFKWKLNIFLINGFIKKEGSQQQNCTIYINQFCVCYFVYIKKSITVNCQKMINLLDIFKKNVRKKKKKMNGLRYLIQFDTLNKKKKLVFVLMYLCFMFNG